MDVISWRSLNHVHPFILKIILKILIQTNDRKALPQGYAPLHRVGTGFLKDDHLIRNASPVVGPAVVLKVAPGYHGFARLRPRAGGFAADGSAPATIGAALPS